MARAWRKVEERLPVVDGEESLLLMGISSLVLFGSCSIAGVKFFPSPGGVKLFCQSVS